MARVLALVMLLAGHAQAGTVIGTVTFVGTPALPALPAVSDPACKTVADGRLVAGAGNLVKDAVVMLARGQAPAASPPKQPAIIDQKGCTFLPRVQPVVKGQKVAFTNSDRTLHNVHGYVADETIFNVAQPAGAPRIERTVDEAHIIRIRCDVHPWMEAHLVMTEHGRATTSDAKGAFTLRDVPAGKRTVEAWHPVLGRTSAEVVVGTGTTKAALVFRVEQLDGSP